LGPRREPSCRDGPAAWDLEDWAKLLGDVVVVGPLIDRLMHHGHLLKFEGKSWRLKEAAARIAKRESAN
jgi:DNA replication protein DnaC